MREKFDSYLQYICEIEPIKSDDEIVEMIPYNLGDIKNGKTLIDDGIGPFCIFNVQTEITESCVYAIIVDKDIKYIGRATNLKRILLHYYKISKSSCFKGGNSTYCKINNFILNQAKLGKRIYIYGYKCSNINEMKKIFLEKYTPILNS